MNKISLFSLSVILILAACNKRDQEPEEIVYPNHLLGTWIYSNIENETQIMHKSDSLLLNRYGFTVFPNGMFVERKNSGWCGEGGEYIFEDYKGEWKQPDHLIYHVKVDYCEGVVEYEMIIDYIFKDSLRFHYDFSHILP